TLPHKRNPVGCAAILAAGARVPALVSTMLAAMAQEHERGLGGWQAEWETLPQIVLLGAGALERTAELAAQLEVDAGRMRANLEATRGLIRAEAIQMALAPSIGRPAAHELVERACREAVRSGRSLRAVLLDDAAIAGRLTPSQIDALLEPAGAVGASDTWIDRVLAAAETDDERG
ncbi:MAG TPA: 3-carboxy-cis,cis-muconate cycloisomerase, partial [Burkholderiaceae bacterium]